MLLLSLFIFFENQIFSADYEDLHNVLTDFYCYQRSGTKGSNPYNPFYPESPYPHEDDRYDSITPLDGGWYDAGDFVKFGLPLGFATYCLLKSYDAFPNSYNDNHGLDHSSGPDGIPDILNETKVATDYLKKAVVSSSTVILDVGSGLTDHSQWIDGYTNSSTFSRPVYTADGADIGGMYAASLALMYTLYKDYDEQYAESCRSKAIEAFIFCKNHKNTSILSAQVNGGYQNEHGEWVNTYFYQTNTWKDKMACGAVELYRATGDDEYLNGTDGAIELMSQVSMHNFVLGYANCGDLAAFELCRLGYNTGLSTWESDIGIAVSRVVDAPGTLIHGAHINSDWGVCRDAANAAFSAALLYLIKGKNVFRDFAFQQINWVAGFPPFTKSYIVRYNNGPQHPHHRNDNNITSVDLIGGIVSGPGPIVDDWFNPSRPQDYIWEFEDVTSYYKYTEVAIDYNAGAIGAVAFIRDYNNPPESMVRIESPVYTTDESGNPVDRVDFTEKPVFISMEFDSNTFDDPHSWEIVITGNTSSAEKIFSGSGTTILKEWDGSSDNGEFVSGENVSITVNLTTSGDYIGENQKSHVNTSILIYKGDEAFNENDLLIDDFEDGDSLNKVGGYWEGFSDKTEGISGGISNIPQLYYSNNIGKDESSGIFIIATGNSGAENPFTGVKTTFSSSGDAVDIGNITSLIMDIKSSTDNTNLRIEFEQSDITGQEYYGYSLSIPEKGKWTRIRIPISSFQLPEGAKDQPDLDLTKISSIRFTFYGTRTANFYIDNLHLENTVLIIPIIKPVYAVNRQNSWLRVTPNCIIYHSPELMKYKNNSIIKIYNLSGKTVFCKRIPYSINNTVIISNAGLSSGIYTLIHTVNGEIVSPAIQFVNIKKN